MNGNTISVIVPVYNAQKHVAEAIQSIQRQTYRVDEIIAVDDGSTDDSAEVLAAFPEVKCFRQANQGAGAARNQGVRLASGSWLAFLDADDVWSVDKIEKQAAVLNSDACIDAVFGHARQTLFNGKLNDGSLDSWGQILPAHLPSAMMIRRTSFERTGEFATDLVLSEAVDWFCRAVDAGLSWRMLSDVVYLRRIHDNNLGLRERANRHEYLRVVRQSLHRRRGNGG